MTGDSIINIKVSKNDNILKNINEKTHLDAKNWTEYIKSLKNAQKTVNTYLTQLVDQEKSTDGYTNAEEEEECEDSDEDDESAENAKRKLESDDNDTNRKKRNRDGTVS